ncbi:MAG: hypothetical protein CMK09_09825 [Ponticaulis sp.]|nr:hypothetical protein [Ponticaulis sp.]|tara:strand:+ start:16836 stop:17174 length:339 start_codon:yes stop_codon:yes gene_type:complete
MSLQTRPLSEKRAVPVHFERLEMDAIMNVYGRMVAAGEWRDYALNMHKDRAIFSIFKRATEMPIYRIEKQPALARKQGAWSILSAEGVILKRGQDLKTLLTFFDRKKFRVVN